MPPRPGGGLKEWRGEAENRYVGQLPVVILGLGLAAWGHLLLLDLRRVVAAWVRLDGLFPPAVRSSPTFGGWALLGAGALLALVPLLG